MLRKKLDRFAPTLSENQGVLFFTQRVLNELAENGRVVGHQDPDLLLASLYLVHILAMNIICRRRSEQLLTARVIIRLYSSNARHASDTERALAAI